MKTLQWALSHGDEDFAFFSRPLGEKTFCGVGCWLEETGTQFNSWNEANDFVQEHPETVLFYRQTFEGESRWILPKQMLVEINGHLEMVSTIFDGSKAHVERRPYSVPLATISNEEMIVRMLSHDPPKEVWDERLAMGKELFHDQILKKIVLARTSMFEFSGDRSQILQRILQNVGNHYRMAIRRRGEPWFFSKSPEKLLRWSEGHLQTVAIAGTAQRQTTKENNLTESSKDQYEHQLVVESILEALRPYARVVRDSPQDILQLSHIVHLRTRIEAEGVAREDLGKIVESLHPTPAVSGYPTKDASHWLQKIEPPRGMYAGLFGFLTHKEAELAVTIRCGFLSQQEMQITTGVGVVEESDLESEWQELDGKLMQVLDGVVV